MTRVLLVGDERKGKVHTCLDAVTRTLAARGAEVDLELSRDVSLEHREADLVVVLGGDGSILGAVRRMGRNQRPVLGINLGRLGFLTSIPEHAAVAGIEQALDGTLTEERRMMLECVVLDAQGEPRWDPVPVVNDVVLSAQPASGIVRLTASRMDRELGAYSGDGLIVATPIGSTAYSLAAGGPILSPRMEALVLTPLAPHSISLRPLIVPIRGGLRLRVTDTGRGDSCSLVVDGQVTREVGTEDDIRVTRSSVDFRHLTLGPGQFFSVLRDKFGWSDEPRWREDEGESND